MLVSPELTGRTDWEPGVVVEVEDNPFVGVVVAAETEDGDVFFGRKDLFKSRREEVCLP